MEIDIKRITALANVILAKWNVDVLLIHWDEISQGQGKKVN